MCVYDLELLGLIIPWFCFCDNQPFRAAEYPVLDEWPTSAFKAGLFFIVIVKHVLSLPSSLKLEIDILIAWKRNARKSLSKTKKNKDELKP